MMKPVNILLVVLVALLFSSCRRTVIYHRPTQVQSAPTRTYRAPSAPTKTIPGTPMRISDPSPAGTRTTY